MKELPIYSALPKPMSNHEKKIKQRLSGGPKKKVVGKKKSK